MWTLGEGRVSYAALRASPVGRCTSSSAISIIFPISLLLILPRKPHSLTCRRFKIHQKSWMFKGKHDEAAALHSSSTCHLRRHVFSAEFVLKRVFTAGLRSNFPTESWRLTRIITPPPQDRPRWRQWPRLLWQVQHGGREEEHEERTSCVHPLISSFSQHTYVSVAHFRLWFKSFSQTCFLQISTVGDEQTLTIMLGLKHHCGL